MKLALIIATTEYSDSNLAKLSAPANDAEDLASVLKKKDIAGFDDVKIVLNQPESIVREEIDEFFDRKKSDDMLLLYFSGHGVRDEMGALYLALKNTNLTRLRATGIKSDFIREAMDQSYSKRQILILDCCNSGAFAQGTKASIGGSMGTATAFRGNGYGRVILTASDATQFAWEGNQVIGETQNSLFTHYLIEGLKGKADNDGDGKITIDDLYDYAYENIISKNPKQTPGKWSFSQKGEIVICQRINRSNAKPLSLPDDLTDALTDSRTWVREGALRQLEILLNGKNLRLARSAHEALERIVVQDDSKGVSQMAQQILNKKREEIPLQDSETRETTKDKPPINSNELMSNEHKSAQNLSSGVFWFSWFGRIIIGVVAGLILGVFLNEATGYTPNGFWGINMIPFSIICCGVSGWLVFPNKYFWLYLFMSFTVVGTISGSGQYGGPEEFVTGGILLGLPVGALISRIVYWVRKLIVVSNNKALPASAKSSEQIKDWTMEEVERGSIEAFGVEVVICPSCKTINSLSLVSCRNCSTSIEQIEPVKNPYQNA